jgi:hypothetical protein
MPVVHATIARHPFDLTREAVESAMRDVPPESLQTHYVVVGRRRYPPKQVIAAVTGLDRSTFISTQARSVLERLGFTVGRVGSPPRKSAEPIPVTEGDDRLGREAEMLRPHRGEYVAVDPDWTEVIASGPDPRSVSRALTAIGRVGVIFEVPADPARDIGGFAW